MGRFEVIDMLQEAEHTKTMDEIRERIKSDEINKTVNVEKQNRHIRDTHEYVEGRSYLFDCVDAQEIVNRYHGTGHTPISKSGWGYKEIVVTNDYIGVDIDRNTGRETITNRITIHYSNTGAHIVPAKPTRR